MIKRVLKELCPPIALKVLRRAREKNLYVVKNRSARPDQQHLDMYWDETFAQLLDTWGEKTAWPELKFLMANCKGKTLDIACGTGKCMEILATFSDLELHGCDISDLLIKKAIKRGIESSRLTICDATQMPYGADTFEHAYTVGSLEHFTEDGIRNVISEMHRVTSGRTFHLTPCSKSGKNEGWLTTTQSFFNNTPEWWVEMFKTKYRRVLVLDSSAIDEFSDSKWFLCDK